MIGFLKGFVCEVTEDNLLLDVNGVGYNIIISAKEAESVTTLNQELKIYTYLSVREDAMKLYGFLSREDLAFFKLLIGVNGIGPKGAQGVLSAMGPDELRYAILSGDAKTISKCPGIGTKTAQRIILDLKDKVDIEKALDLSLNGGSASGSDSGALSDDLKEASLALSALGFSSVDAMKAVRSVELVDGMSVEDIIKGALRYLS